MPLLLLDLADDRGRRRPLLLLHMLQQRPRRRRRCSRLLQLLHRLALPPETLLQERALPLQLRDGGPHVRLALAGALL